MNTTRASVWAVLAAAALLPRVAGAAEGKAEKEELRKRYDPGLAIAALYELRGFEGMESRVAGVPALSQQAGLGVGYSFDLVDVRAEALFSLTLVGEKRPIWLKARVEYAFATFGGFSVMGELAPQVVLNAPELQSGSVGGTLFGPELGVSARYRISPMFDAYVTGTGSVLSSLGDGPRRFFFDPGVFAGIAVHPFGKEG